MRQFLFLLLIPYIALYSCGNKQFTDSDYEAFCVKMATEFNTGSRGLNETCNINQIKPRVSSRLTELGVPMLQFYKGQLESEMDNFSVHVTNIKFIKLRTDKNGIKRAVFMVVIDSDKRNYREYELIQVGDSIYWIDYYDFFFGGYLSQYVAESFGLGYKYDNNPNIESYNPAKIIIKIAKLTQGEPAIEEAIVEFNKLNAEDRQLKLAEYMRIALAYLAGGDVMQKEINAMLLEKKRDPRFFHFHQYNLSLEEGDYNQAISSFKKLLEYTGSALNEFNELFTLYMLTNQNKEAELIIAQIDNLAEDEGATLLGNLLIAYDQEDRKSFDMILKKVEAKLKLTGEELYFDIYDRYTALLVQDEYQMLEKWIIDSSRSN